jgi:hypothetical protein
MPRAARNVYLTRRAWGVGEWSPEGPFAEVSILKDLTAPLPLLIPKTKNESKGRLLPKSIYAFSKAAFCAIHAFAADPDALSSTPDHHQRRTRHTTSPTSGRCMLAGGIPQGQSH